MCDGITLNLNYQYGEVSFGLVYWLETNTERLLMCYNYDKLMNFNDKL